MRGVVPDHWRVQVVYCVAEGLVPLAYVKSGCHKRLPVDRSVVAPPAFAPLLSLFWGRTLVSEIISRRSLQMHVAPEPLHLSAPVTFMFVCSAIHFAHWSHAILRMRSGLFQGLLTN